MLAVPAWRPEFRCPMLTEKASERGRLEEGDREGMVPGQDG